MTDGRTDAARIRHSLLCTVPYAWCRFKMDGLLCCHKIRCGRASNTYWALRSRRGFWAKRDLCENAKCCKETMFSCRYGWTRLLYFCLDRVLFLLTWRTQYFGKYITNGYVLVIIISFIIIYVLNCYRYLYLCEFLKCKLLHIQILELFCYLRELIVSRSFSISPGNTIRFTHHIKHDADATQSYDAI